MWSVIAVFAAFFGLAALFPFAHQEYLDWKLNRAMRKVGLLENQTEGNR